MKDLIKAIKDHIRVISKRVDVEVRIKEIGKRAPKSLTKPYRGSWPDEILDFYENMNGLHFEWSFIEDGGNPDGCIRIPPLTGNTKFENSGKEFGQPDSTVLVFDELQPEAISYILRDANNDFSIAFARAAEEEDYSLVATSIKDYLEQAISNNFGWYWPEDSEENQELARRLSKPAIKPAAIRKGVRVHCNAFVPATRATVVKTTTTPSADSYFGREFALLNLDNGCHIWSQFKWVKALKKPDLYEQIYASPKELWAELAEQSPEDLLVSLGMLAVSDTMCASDMTTTLNGKQHLVWESTDYQWRTFNLLHSLSVDEGIKAILSVLEKIWSVEPDNKNFRADFEPDLRLFDKAEYKRRSYTANRAKQSDHLACGLGVFLVERLNIGEGSESKEIRDRLASFLEKYGARLRAKPLLDAFLQGKALGVPNDGWQLPYDRLKEYSTRCGVDDKYAMVGGNGQSLYFDPRPNQV